MATVNTTSSSAALYLRQFEPLVVPGLLQTERYTRAMLATRMIDKKRADRIVQTRKERQEILEEPPRSWTSSSTRPCCAARLVVRR